MKRTLSIFCFSIALVFTVIGTQAQINYVTTKREGSFPLVEPAKPTSLFTSDNDYPGVLRAAGDLQQDIERVTNTKPQLLSSKPSGKEVVLIGTIGKSEIIDELISKGKLKVSDVKGKWESFVTTVIDKPMDGVERALVIAGSDKRGTIYGIYDLSKQIGVSPWYWWADVPPKKSSSLYIQPGRYVQGEPPVKYRGIFINDEEPALGRWAVEKYGGFNHQVYEKVFELILRMKGNYLWPAMWWASFNSDDTLNPKIADEYGIVMGTTHHEPMNRAHAEWRKTGKGPWNYDTNEATLREFWKKGIERMGDRETIISLGMRGDGDMAMTEDTNIALLQRIVKDQREMITNITGKDIKQTPQLWALYKEVQDYYDKGMRTPDDVTLLLCDDNWGNIRKLPKVEDSLRTGGYGIYYHFDYVGDPRNYKWVNTNPIARVYEQMHMAYQYGANRIWIVNVGDIKPVEFPIEFFLDYAWNPELWNPDNLDDYTRQWAAGQFGNTHAAEIGDIISLYSKYNGRRKPELLSAETYSLTHYREAEKVLTDYHALVVRAEKVNAALSPEYKDAYFQLVLHPVKASANHLELWVTVARNRLYAQQGRASTNDLAEKAKALFSKDAELSKQYNKDIAGGKWNHMMDQTHISYTYWQQPEKDVLPEVKAYEPLADPTLGVAIEGSDKAWPSETSAATIPDFDVYNQQSRYIDLFNKGKAPFNFSIKTSAPWIKVSAAQGKVDKEQRIEVTVDWKKIPKGNQQGTLTIAQENGKSVTVAVRANNPATPTPTKVNGFVESDGYVSMGADHFTNKVNTPAVSWKVIPDLGKTGSAITTFPVTAPSVEPGGNSPRLEYSMYTFSGGDVKIHTYFSPTLNYNGSEGLRYAISIDDEAPQIINMHQGRTNATWMKWVADNIIEKVSTHQLSKPGQHTVKFWMVDSGVVLQKLVVETTGMKPSYLGPPESFRRQESKTKK